MDFNQHDKKYYQFPRTSKEAYGYEVKDDDFDMRVPHKGDQAVAIGCLLIVVFLIGYFGLGS